MMLESWARLDSLEIIGRTTLVLVAILAARLALTRASAATRHLVQALGLAAVLLLPLAAITLPALDLALLPAAPAASAVPVADSAARAPGVPLEVLMTLDESPARAAFARPAVVTSPQTRAARGWPAATWLALAWLAGVAVFGGRSVLGWLRLARRSARARPVDAPHVVDAIAQCRERLGLRSWPRILIGSEIRVPMVWGFCRPTLLLPDAVREWSEERLRVVLLHELAHLRRLDGLTLLIGRLATTFHWFNPLAWVVDRAARRDCEQACDDVVLNAGERPSSYARHLLAIASGLPPMRAERAAALALAGRSHFEDRVRAILHPRLRRGLPRGGVFAALAAAALVLGFASTARIVADEPQAPPASEPRLREAAEPEGMLLAQNYKIKEKQKDQAQGEPGAAAFKRAYELHSQERWTEAIAAFEQAAAAGYRPATATYNAACGYARLEQAGPALRALEEALELGFDSDYLFQDHDLDPIRSDRDFRALLEQVAEEQGAELRNDPLEEARAAYDTLVAEDSKVGHAWYKVGSALLGLREFDTAMDALERAERLLPDNSNALYNMACGYSLQGRTDAALDMLERAVLAGFDSEERFRDDSDLAAIRGTSRFEELRELNHTLSLDRFREDGWSDTEYSDTRWNPAVAEFTAYTRSHPSVGRAWFDLGWALHFSHRHDEAADAFAKAVDLGYRTATSSYNVACARAMQGETDAALDWLQRAVDAGFTSAGHMADDDDLESLHGDPRFQAIVGKLELQDRDDEDGLVEKIRLKVEHALKIDDSI